MKNFDSAQVEQLRDISQQLLAERQQKNMSLEEIAIKTYIPLRLLQALELGQLERLPEPVFVQGFIRRYADILGLDGMALAKTFSTESVAQTSTLSESYSLTGSQASNLELVGDRLPSTAVEQPIGTSPNRSVKPTESAIVRSANPIRSRGLLILAGVTSLLLLGVAINSVSRSKQFAESQESAISSIVNSQKSSSQPNAANQPTLPQSVTAPKATSPSNSGTPVEVAVNLVGESWLQVDIDGKTEFEGILKKGVQRTWKAKKTLVLQSGNAGAVSVSYNQGKAKLMGAPGEVKDAMFPPKQPRPNQTNQ